MIEWSQYDHSMLLSFPQLFELGPDGGDHETDGDLLAETDVLAYDCAAR